ncbi:olfactory receptor 12-like [Protobothrops mucrosquamatus]|uniref:olfactory receptor 12-like n=1 Tax=Protobothrops mucrosquamatus TaxID=103944 RepID=UPI000775DA38|nr:olfactory receptor 12-like [Protobothrops mucrosquamatus]
MENHTEVTEFILIGFKDQPKVRISLFVLFLVIYIITLGGNMGLIIITTVDVQLHSPMYFFLKNLSFLDICYSSVITPKAMLGFITGNKTISYSGCAAQMFFFSLFGTTEAFFLAVMAYDRFIAICSPLLYHIIMSQKRCVCLLSISYFFGFINCCIQTGFTFSLSFCDSLVIDHFFCDVPAVMKISCSVTFVNELVLLSVCGFIIVTTAVVVIVSYVYIISTIINIPSVKGKQKAFSTCTSHLMAVSLFFGTVFFMYAQPGALSSPNQGKVVSLFYTVVIPMLNPIIYSLRNREVKEALNRQLRKIDT